MSSEPHHSPCLWRWRQPEACEQCPQWSCLPGSAPCPLCPDIFLWHGIVQGSFTQMCIFYYTCYDYYCASSGNIHSICLWDKIVTTAWFFIFQCHDYLWMIVIIHIKFERFKPVASYVKAHNQSWGWSNCPWYPDLGSKKQIYLQIPISLHWIKLSSLYCLSSGWFLETF